MNKILPPRYFMVFLFLSIALHFIFPVRRIIYSPYTYLGILPIIFGIFLNLWADQLFKRKGTTVKPFEEPVSLETSGPFRISRHPMYLGMALILLGTSVMSGALITFLFPVAFVIIMEIDFIPTEEKNLGKVFGKKYLVYRKKVRRWI